MGDFGCSILTSAQFHGSAYRKHRIGAYGSRQAYFTGKRRILASACAYPASLGILRLQGQRRNSALACKQGIVIVSRAMKLGQGILGRSEHAQFTENDGFTWYMYVSCHLATKKSPNDEFGCTHGKLLVA